MTRILGNAWTTAICASVVVLAAAGCGSDDSSASNDSAGASDSVATSESDSTGETVGDACGLISDAEITQLIGDHGPGTPSSAGTDGPACFWENPDTYYSVTVTIGNPDTAINGTLPPLPEGIGADPLPNGMRNLGGAVEFAADRRLNSVQVVNSESADTQQSQAIALAEKIAAQLNG